MKMYGSYSDEDLNDWQQFPQVASVLTSSLFGAWLLRRDENKAKQFPTIPLTKVELFREEIQKLRGCSCSCSDGIIDDVEDILDKLTESED